MRKPWYLRLFSTTPNRPGAPDAHARAMEGDAESQFFLGVRYSSGEEAERDLSQALHWYRLAAEQNHSLAQFNLGMMLEQGQGTERDSVNGRRWIRRAADAGDAGAQFNCGTHCYREMVRQREKSLAVLRTEAYMWFELAALQGYRDSEATRNRIIVLMNHAEVAEANQWVAQFVPTTVGLVES
jgi:TPR repeat protein